MTKIILVRHGHVDWHEPERFRGRADVRLSERGRRQARAAALAVATTWRLDSVYTSPLARCRETAAAFAAPFRLEPRAVYGLADIDYGEWQGLTREEAGARSAQELALWLRAPHLARIPGGEALAAVHARASVALVDILRLHPGASVAVVGHDCVNRVLLLFALGLPLSRYWHIGQDPCAINELDYAEGEFFVRGVNATQHLPAA